MKNTTAFSASAEFLQPNCELCLFTSPKRRKILEYDKLSSQMQGNLKKLKLSWRGRRLHPNLDVYIRNELLPRIRTQHHILLVIKHYRRKKIKIIITHSKNVYYLKNENTDRATVNSQRNSGKHLVRQTKRLYSAENQRTLIVFIQIRMAHILGSDYLYCDNGQNTAFTVACNIYNVA